MKSYLFIALLVFSLVFSSCSFAIDDSDVEYEFLPESFVFEYNDHNASVYEGDSGLKVAYVNSSLDDNRYMLPVERVRGIAYATRGTFSFDEPVLITHGPLREWDGFYIITSLKFKNGTVIPYLGIEKDDLTREQKKYFDDYESQRSEYLMKQQEYAAEDLYDYETVHNSKRSKFSYYYGSGDRGIIYTP